MSRAISALLGIALLFSALAFGQGTGTIVGTVADESGAVIPNATVTLTYKATGVIRTVTTNSEGYYSAPALATGEYQLKVEATGFRTLERDANLQVGATLTVNMPMSVGEAKQVVTVEAAANQMNYEKHEIAGVIEHATIEGLPSNGRDYIQLATLEPGVQISTGTIGQFNALFYVSVLGSGFRTSVTVDGGNVSDNIDVAGGGQSMNFTQEVVQEFQLSEVNIDLSAPIQTGGSINVVTRSGSNDWHGSAYFFFRDHNMAAYPNLFRVGPKNPFFIRRNPGASIGGPIKKDKLFFFFNYEFLNQVQAQTVTTTDPAFQGIQGTYASPYDAKKVNLRVDYRINAKNNMFVRYSHDGNDGFGPALTFGDPSNWPHNVNWSDQSILGLTSILTPTLVNDLRLQYNYWNNHNLPAIASDCSGPCVAGSLPNVVFFVGTNQQSIGPNLNSPQARNTRRYEFVESLSWQKGSHRFKFGGDLNPTYSAGLWGFCTPVCLGAVSPTFIRGILPPGLVNLLFPYLPPGNITSDAQVLNLPVYNINPAIFSGIGVGSVPLPAAYYYDKNKNYDQFRAYFQDVWKVRPNLTFNYGIAWNAQTGFYNSQLSKPALLAPILGTGPDNLGPTVNNLHEFQPAIGFAWSPGKSQKWVIRGGAGIYWDSTPGYYKLREAAALGPPGSARNTLAASAFTNIYPGIFNLNTASPIPVGAPLPINALTNMPIGAFVALVNAELPAVSALLSPSNPPRSGPFPYSEIQYEHQGVEIYPTHNPMARSYQTSIGVQRLLPGSMVLEVNWARRQGENISLGEVDGNLFTRYLGTPTPVPVIPLCPTNPDFNPTHNCSTGGVTFWNSQGRARYDALLVKLNKALTNRIQFLVSYAYQKDSGDGAYGGSPLDNLNFATSYGEDLAHHNLNVSGVVNLPWGFTFSANSSIISRSPVNAVINGLDLPGTAPSGSTETIPGLNFNCLAVGCSKDTLVKVVQLYNANYAGKPSAQGPGSPNPGPFVLPKDYQFGDPIYSQDFRLTKAFTYKEKYKLNIFGEVFNMFNISNLTYPNFPNFQLDPLAPGCSLTNGAFTSCSSQTYQYGQPTGRLGQTFGQGGARAFQVGARFLF